MIAVGDIRKVKLPPRVSPRYLDGALVELKKERGPRYSGSHLSTEWEAEIVQMERQRPNGRFQVGTICFLSERYLV